MAGMTHRIGILSSGNIFGRYVTGLAHYPELDIVQGPGRPPPGETVCGRAPDSARLPGAPVGPFARRLGGSAEVGRGSQGAPKGREAVSICGSAARAIGHDGVAADRRQLSALPAERLGGRRP
ncbi:hypothetical protein [Streptomyces malaysiensis]|uniref:hypothetical protein n=1 Tax=Streptomyces malaysiensis TaxID=92644 RepID=UPI0011CE68FB|nr:hypothetical protein [Streptomyces malaysiensis]